MKTKVQKEKNHLAVLSSIYLAVLGSIYLLYPGFGGYEEITAQKWNAYLLMTGLYVGAALLIRIETALIGEKKIRNPLEVWRELHLPQKLFLGYLLATVVSALVSEFRETAIWGGPRCEGLVAIVLYGGSFLLVSVYGRPRRWMLWLFAAAVSVNCILALLQIAGYNPLCLYPDGMNYYDANKRYAGEFLGTIGNVDVLSALLSFSVPAFIGAMLRWRDDPKRYLLLLPTGLCLAVLFKSFVAGGILGVTGGVLLSVPVLLNGKTARRRVGVLVAGLFVLTALLVYLFGEKLGGFLYEASELMHGRWKDEFGSSRIYIWRNVIGLVPERLLFGGGPDTLGYRMTVGFERYDETLDFMIHSTIDTAHNEYLNILVNQGVIALGFYLAALIASAVAWIRTAVKDPIAAICGCAVLGYSIQAFFGISSPITTPYLWMALAFLNRTGKAPVEDTKEKRRLK